MAAARPARNIGVGRCRRKSHATRVTKIDARLASRVELATEVCWIEACQKPRSPAKAMPAARRSIFRPVKLPGEDLRKRTGSHSAGTARATRQNAVAVGPHSDRRTKIGESAMHVAPK